jgi:OPA family sugar phosphate sensor protein UhpC-like MFS transporter
VFPRIFGLTWLAYCGYYLCRKNFSVLMPFLKTEQGYTSEALAHVLFLYSAAYAIGQFAMGHLADRFGARIVVTFGALGSAAASALTGSLVPLTATQGANGFLQASGWPGVMKMSREWFPATNRGVIMAWWGTHLVVGGFVATNLAAFSTQGDWRRAAWIPSLVLAAIAIVFGLFSRNQAREASGVAPKARGPLPLNPALIAIAVMYFFVKMSRYSFLFWLPLYMTERLLYSPVVAGYTSSIFEGVGFAGALAAGYISERATRGKRFPVGAVMMGGLALICAAYPWFSRLGPAANLAAIALMGAFTFGPDTLMAGSGTQEAVAPEATARAAGFVNGVGSVGQVLSPYFVALISAHYGWDAMFYSLGATSVLGAIALATQWRK